MIYKIKCYYLIDTDHMWMQKGVSDPQEQEDWFIKERDQETSTFMVEDMWILSKRLMKK